MVALFKIDNNVSIPSITAGGSRGMGPRTSTIMALKPGQSFFVAKERGTCKASEVAKILSSSYGHIKKKFPNRNFCVRTVEENGKEGARIWRLADTRKR